jgi:hypothetical protein
MLTHSLECLNELANRASFELGGWLTNKLTQPREPERADLRQQIKEIGDDEFRHDCQDPNRIKDVRGALVEIAETLISRRTAGWREGQLDDRKEPSKPEIQHVLLRPPLPRDKRPSDDDLVDDFVALHFGGYFWHVFLQLRNLLGFATTAFILAAISLNSYPFEPHGLMVWGITAVFLILGAGSVLAFMQMDHDPILSRCTKTEAGKVDVHFWFRLISFGGLPLVTVVSAQFPAVGRFLFAWVKPVLDGIH